MVLEQYRRKLSKEEINALPIRRYEGEVRLVRSEEELESALELLRGESVLGFDTETKPSFRKGKVNAPALIQLAAAEVVYLVQLLWVPMSAGLAELLASPHILKVGVSIHDDMRELQKKCPFTPGGVVDLGDVARAHRLETQGLRNLAANFFHCRISKGPQCSNWGLPVLAERQVIYAATDAWIGREVYLRMHELGLVPVIPSEEKGQTGQGAGPEQSARPRTRGRRAATRRRPKPAVLIQAAD